MRAPVGIVTLLCCCAGSAPPERSAPPGLGRYAAAVDWKAAGVEASTLLSDYLKVDTFNPPGNEQRGARFLAEALEREGIAARVIDLGDGRANLIARLEGSAPADGQPREKPLCLLSHL